MVGTHPDSSYVNEKGPQLSSTSDLFLHPVLRASKLIVESEPWVQVSGGGAVNSCEGGKDQRLHFRSSQVLKSQKSAQRTAPGRHCKGNRTHR